MSALVDREVNWASGPFGDTDASRRDALADYIEIDGVVPPIRRPSDHLRYRFIVGRKGSGKTHYLKALRQWLQKTDNYVLQQVEAISTDDVVTFTKAARRFHAKLIESNETYVDPDFYVRDFWWLSWDRAIYCSVASIIISRWKNPKNDNDKHLKDIVSEDELDKLARFLRVVDEVRSPAGALSAFVQTHTSFNRVRRFLLSPDWAFVTRLIDNAVANLPPIVIVIDAIDDHFEAAPEAWLFCQDGLFRAIVGQLNGSGHFSNRVHAIAAIRDVVYSSLLRSDHALRYVDDSHIFQIRWDYRACWQFFSKKLERISNTKILSIVDWLKTKSIRNDARELMEPIEQYVIRHTRHLPRDVVFIGNALSRIGLDADEKKIIETVHRVAKLLAEESIITSINECLISKENIGDLIRLIPDHKDDVIVGGSALSTIATDMKGVLKSRIEKFFSGLGRDVFGAATLRDALVSAGLASSDDFVEGRVNAYRFDHILWRQGLLAYQDRVGATMSWRFFNSGPFESFMLPPDAPRYGLHSIVMDLYPSVSVGHGSEPVM